MQHSYYLGKQLFGPTLCFFPPQKYSLNVNYLYKLRCFLLINLAAAPDHEHKSATSAGEQRGLRSVTDVAERNLKTDFFFLSFLEYQATQCFVYSESLPLNHCTEVNHV